MDAKSVKLSPPAKDRKRDYKEPLQRVELILFKFPETLNFGPVKKPLIVEKNFEKIISSCDRFINLPQYNPFETTTKCLSPTGSKVRGFRPLDALLEISCNGKALDSIQVSRELCGKELCLNIKEGKLTDNLLLAAVDFARTSGCRLICMTKKQYTVLIEW